LHRSAELPEARVVLRPIDIQLVGNEVAIRWSDGAESYLRAPALRAASPSAAARGEPDIFGRIHGGEGRREFEDVTVLGWHHVGNYAICFEFSDGHRTGLYSYELLRRLAGEGAQP
jgi:DUF971 family protein